MIRNSGVMKKSLFVDGLDFSWCRKRKTHYTFKKSRPRSREAPARHSLIHSRVNVTESHVNSDSEQ